MTKKKKNNLPVFRRSSRILTNNIPTKFGFLMFFPLFFQQSTCVLPFFEQQRREKDLFSTTHDFKKLALVFFPKTFDVKILNFYKIEKTIFFEANFTLKSILNRDITVLEGSWIPEGCETPITTPNVTPENTPKAGE